MTKFILSGVAVLCMAVFTFPAMAATEIGVGACGGSVQSQQMNPNPERQRCYDNARYNPTPMSSASAANAQMIREPRARIKRPRHH